MGVIVGIIVISKLMRFLFAKYKSKTYFGILGFTLSSIALMFINTLNNDYNFLEIIIGLIMLVVGYKFSKKLSL